MDTPTIPQIQLLFTFLPMKMEQSVPKRRHIKFRRRRITQKKTYNIALLVFIGRRREAPEE
jgi:hypothetical protein